MKTHSLIQGSPEWIAHRASHFNASDAPAMMGCSPYKTRTQLLHEMHTGLTPDVDAATQRRFDDGHRFEALARPLAEDIIGEELYPVTGSEGKLSASFDGLTMMEDVAFEHKTLNEDLHKAFNAMSTINPAPVASTERHWLMPLQYRVQMEQQLMVSGAGKCLFMASKWQGDELVEERHCWYSSDDVLREAIERGWEQFEIDLAAYVPTEAVPVAVAAPTLGLPAVSIQVNGSIALTDNLSLFGAALTAYIAKINTKPETDQDFADLDGAAKTMKRAEEQLEAAESNALAQTASIDTMRRTVAQYKELARQSRLLFEKLFKTEKDNRKLAIVTAARATFDAHLAGLNTRLGKTYMPAVAADFAAVTKGLKTITSMQNAIDTEMARAKIEANCVADRIQLNLHTLVELASDYKHLFIDTAQIVLKAPDDLTALVKSRISDFKASEEKRLEDEREKIRVEVLAKIETERLAKEAADKAEYAKAELQAAKQSDGVELSPAAQALNEEEGVKRFATVHPARKIIASIPAQSSTRDRINRRLDRMEEVELIQTLAFIQQQLTQKAA